MSRILGRRIFVAAIIATVITGFFPSSCVAFHVQSTSRTNRVSTVPTFFRNGNSRLVVEHWDRRHHLRMASSDGATTKQEDVDNLSPTSAKIGTITDEITKIKGTDGNDAEREVSTSDDETSDDDEETSLIVKVLFGLFLVLGEFYLIVALQ